MRLRRSSWRMALALLAFGSISAAQEPTSKPSFPPAESLALDRAVELAQANHPTLAMALADIRASRGGALQAGLYPNPEFAVGSPQWAGSDSQYFAMLSQEIVTRGKKRLDRSAACKELTQAELRFVRARFDVLTTVRKSFYSALASQQRVARLDELVSVTEASRKVGEGFWKSGLGNKSDFLQLSMEYERSRVLRQNAMAILNANRVKLAADLGLIDLKIGTIDGDLTAKMPDFDPSAIENAFKSNNALVQSAYVDIDRSRVLLRRAVVEPVPNVTIQAGYQYSVTPLNNQAVVQLGFPIPVWNRNQGAIQTARANLAKSVEATRQIEYSLAAQLAQLQGTYTSARQQVEQLQQRILPQINEAVSISQQGKDQGEVDALRLVQVQKSLIELELSLIDALESGWLAASDIADILQVERFP